MTTSRSSVRDALLNQEGPPSDLQAVLSALGLILLLRGTRRGRSEHPLGAHIGARAQETA